MSYDLVIWPGSPGAATQRWKAIRDEERGPLPMLPHDELLTSLRAAFGSDLRVLEGNGFFEVAGRGWEADVGSGTHTTVSCNWALTSEDAMLAVIVRAAHAAGCSVYDPQDGAYWPAFATPVDDGLWDEPFFDEGWTYDDEDDNEGHPADVPVRLQPHEILPAARQVWLEVPASLARAAPGQERARIGAYLARFSGWEIFAVFTGPEAEAPTTAECRKLLGTRAVTPLLGEEVGVIAFHVLGAFDPLVTMAGIEPCPFELVAQSAEETLLGTILGELPIRLVAVVAKRALGRAPDVIRAGLRALHTAAAQSGPVHYSNPLAAPDAAVGANVGWVEALLGLTPRELPIEADPATVPRPPAPDDDDGDDEDLDQ